MRLHVQTRFLKKVQKTDGCWLWKASCNHATGYAQFWYKGQMRPAYRVAFELFCGPIPEGLDILHSCDVRACVNPAHLRPGTHQENMLDRDTRGRGVSLQGESRPNAKLTDEKVRAIRKDSRSSPMIAAEFGVSQSLVKAIKAFKRWAHVV